MIIQYLWVFAVTVFAKLVSGAAMTKRKYERETSASVDSTLEISNGTQHAFFRSMDARATSEDAGSRRVFGGAAAELNRFPAVCALLDRYRAVRCTATIVTQHWVLTAAHCVTPNIAYVKYNTQRPASTDGNVTAVYFLYQHPKYEVLQKDEGRGLDVTMLHHDVGLVRTRDVMELTAPQTSVLHNLRLTDPLHLYNRKVEVFGFGRTERSVLGEELFAVTLQLVRCERADWVHCICGVATEPRGVCSGDSGGPLLYRGHPIGVTSMGPVECARSGGAPHAAATSVFTALYQYADVINATIHDTENALRMRIISRAVAQRLRLPLFIGPVLSCLSYSNLLSFNF